MTTLYDSTVAADIPEDAPAVAGYIDGEFADWEALVARFPNVPRISITVLGGNAAARVCDVEKGNLSPQSAAEWCKTQIAGGHRPTVYCSKDNQATVVTAFTAAGVNANSVDWWLADWTYEPHQIGGTVATQYADPPTSGGHFDLSMASPGWLGLEAAPPPPGPSLPVPPAPAPEPAPAPGGFMPPEIKAGSVSGAVRSAQTLLNMHNAGLSVDGVFGPATEAAVKNFQRIMGLAEDGVVGPQTWTALDAFG